MQFWLCGNVDIKDHIKRAKHKRCLQTRSSTMATYTSGANAGDSHLNTLGRCAKCWRNCPPSWWKCLWCMHKCIHVCVHDHVVHLRVPVWGFENMVILWKTLFNCLSDKKWHQGINDDRWYTDWSFCSCSPLKENGLNCWTIMKYFQYSMPSPSVSCCCHQK